MKNYKGKCALKYSRIKTKIAVLVFFLWVGATCAPQSLWALQPGDRFPDLSAVTLDGQQYPLSHLEGHPVLLQLGTTWCPHCKEMAQRILELGPWLKQNKIGYVEVFLKEDAATVQKYLQQNPRLKMELMLVDDGKIAKALLVRSIPRLVFLDADFRIYRMTSSLSKDNLQGVLQGMLSH